LWQFKGWWRTWETQLHSKVDEEHEKHNFMHSKVQLSGTQMEPLVFWSSTAGSGSNLEELLGTFSKADQVKNIFTQNHMDFSMKGKIGTVRLVTTQKETSCSLSRKSSHSCCWTVNQKDWESVFHPRRFELFCSFHMACCFVELGFILSNATATFELVQWCFESIQSGCFQFENHVSQDALDTGHVPFWKDEKIQCKQPVLEIVQWHCLVGSNLIGGWSLLKQLSNPRRECKKSNFLPNLIVPGPSDS